MSRIRHLEYSDLDSAFAIWESGVREAFRNQNLFEHGKHEFYRSFFAKALQHQDENFKFWGYEEDGVLLAWQSLLPCQSAPTVWSKFAESSTYVRKDARSRGIAPLLLKHAIHVARDSSDLAYVMGYVTEGNAHVEKLVADVGFKKIGVLPKSSKDTIIGETVSIWVVAL